METPAAVAAPTKTLTAASKWLQLRIGAKLTAGFAIILVVMCGLGLFSMVNMGRISGLTTEVSDRLLPATRLAGEMHGNAAELRLAQSAAFFSFDPDVQQKAMEGAAEADKKFVHAFNALNHRQLTPEETGAMQEIREKWTSYSQQHVKMYGLMQMNMLPDLLNIYNGEALETYTDLAQSLNKLAEIEALAGKAAAAAGDSISASSRWLTIVALVVALGLAGAVLVTLLRNIATPLVGMTKAVEDLAAGKTEVVVPALDRSDEIGKLARATDSFKQFFAAERERSTEEQRRAEEIRDLVEKLGNALQKMAVGDLAADLNVKIDGPLGQVTDDFNAAVFALRDLIGTVMDSAAAIRSGAGEIAQASEDLARRTESNAASLEQTSAAMAQIDQRIRASAEAASRTVQRADGAIATVNGGREITDEAVQAMTRVSESAKGIDSVIEGLDKIAFQTRVLAMNAAVEAGRAGEAGRGFAVVADLVSALAMRAEEEAGRARDQLTATQSDIVAAVDMVQKVDGALANISGDVTEVHALVGNMASDNQAQATAISEISAAIGTMDESTQQNAAMVEETSAASRNLSSEVMTLVEQAEKFKIGREMTTVKAVPSPARAPARAVAAPGYKSPVAPLPSNGAVHADSDWASF